MARVLLILTASIALAGCASNATAPATTRGQAPELDPWANEAHPPPVLSVTPPRCRTTSPHPSLKVPDPELVARTPWRLERVGACRIPAGTRNDGVSFVDGWASFPHECAEQSAPYEADGRAIRFGEGGMTMPDCAPSPAGFIDAVTTWGVAKNVRLYLLDGLGDIVFVVAPAGEPGCVVHDEPNSVRIAAPGTPGCLQVPA